MKAKKMPHLQQGGSTKSGRAAREAAVAENLEILRKSDPEGFEAMLELLARLVVSARTRKS